MRSDHGWLGERTADVTSTVKPCHPDPTGVRSMWRCVLSLKVEGVLLSV